MHLWLLCSILNPIFLVILMPFALTWFTAHDERASVATELHADWESFLLGSLNFFGFEHQVPRKSASTKILLAARSLNKAFIYIIVQSIKQLDRDTLNVYSDVVLIIAVLSES